MHIFINYSGIFYREMPLMPSLKNIFPHTNVYQRICNCGWEILNLFKLMWSAATSGGEKCLFFVVVFKHLLCYCFCVYCITTWEETKIQDLFKATSLWNLFSSVDMKVEITSNPPISTGAWISHKWGIPLAWIFSSIRHDCLTWRHFLADSEELLKCDLEALYTVVWSLQIGF